jgi:DNA helicase-2/ATP-dependent DNA helicase PcrA
MNDNVLLLNSLNEAQRKVVSAPQSHLLVLAGAGSGKTRVLVHRIAWLIDVENISPHNILAVTFTNKAAGEMRYRLEGLVHVPVRMMWVGTFHGLAHRLLRQHWKAAGLPQDFQILDSDDQHRLIKRIIKSLNLDEIQWVPKKVQWFINQQKDEAIRSHQVTNANDPYNKTLIRVFQAYEETCTRNGVIDFAEIILRSYELFTKNPDILEHYRTRFQHILVDEFQDTNTIQYAWLKLLSGGHNYLMVVGDDDQSIYGWRGARIENIQRFTQDFPNNHVIRLEQNYRSTGVILAASNALIAHNDGRLGKKLWSSGGKGELISVYGAFNDLDEARFIVNQIEQGLKKGLQANEIAILYRSNAQSRVLEEALIRAQIPYRIYGGLRFFERAEIKDALAYLRLIVNRKDDQAFERIVNTPTRGISEITVQTLRTEARKQSISLWEFSQYALASNLLSARANSAVTAFLQLIDQMDKETKTLSLSEQTEQVLYSSALFAHYKKEKGERGQARIENLEELVNATRQFVPEADNISVLSAFLTHVALEAGEHQGDSTEKCVQLMTLHSAKGLEFPQVFLCGMEEGLFPHHLAHDEPGRLEEERRLCYVGMTRAMQKLYLTYAEVRRLHGTESHHRPSRFISEIPKELLDEVRLKTQIIRPVPLKSVKIIQKSRNNIGDTGLQLGQQVTHPTFGDGVIVDVEGQGGYTRLQVKFNQLGTKWLIANFTKLAIHNQ